MGVLRYAIGREIYAMAKVAVRFRPGTVVTLGLAAGIVFALFEILAAALLIGPASAARPIRMIAAMVLGLDALAPGYPLVIAGTVGLALHLFLSIIYTAILALIVTWISTITREELLSGALGDTFTGVFFGITLYVVNYYVISPMAGWSWFRDGSNVLMEFLSHALFGAVAGWILARSRSHAAAAML
jgi:hypothetical protein